MRGTERSARKKKSGTKLPPTEKIRHLEGPIPSLRVGGRCSISCGVKYRGKVSAIRISAKKGNLFRERV